MEIIKRKLTKSEAWIISEEIKKAENISAYEASSLEKEEDSYVITENDSFAGVAIADHLNSKWTRFKILILLKKFRNRGLGSKIFPRLLEKLHENRKKVYFTTGNPAMIKFAKKTGFIKVNIFQLPLKILLHEAKNIFSAYWIKESLRKFIFSKPKISFKFFIYTKQS